MPGPAGIRIADRLAVDDDVREDQNLGVTRQGELGARADLEVAEPTRKGDLLLGRQFLIVEDQHRVMVVGVVDSFEDVVGQRLRKSTPLISAPTHLLKGWISIVSSCLRGPSVRAWLSQIKPPCGLAAADSEHGPLSLSESATGEPPGRGGASPLAPVLPKKCDG